MSKTIIIKLTKASPKTGPFTISDEYGNVFAVDVPLRILIDGMRFVVEDRVTMMNIESSGTCNPLKIVSLSPVTEQEINDTEFIEERTACIWRHLENTELYNSYYGRTEPYIIEYCFAYPFHDEIVHSVSDYSKVFKYFSDGSGVFSYNNKIETDDGYFNKVVIYNNQQSSGLLELAPKPKNDLYAYKSYPLYNEKSKTVLYTKSDNFYKINTFWDVVIDKTEPVFTTSCESLSAAKLINDDNMDYTAMSFTRSPLRAKELKLRYTLDDRSDIHIVTQFIINEAQLSYK